MTTLPRGRVAVVGPGRVGTVLAVGLDRAGHRVVAAAGGRAASRDRLAARVPGARTDLDPASAAAAADLVVLAAPDDALADLVTGIAVHEGFREGQHVVHVAGSLGLQPLRRAALAGARVAACHPAQTVPSAQADPDVLAGAAWAVTAPEGEGEREGEGEGGWARDLVRDLGGVPHDVADGARGLYHAGLVVGSNAAGAAVATAGQLLRAARVDDPAAFLRPLVEASVENALTGGAEAVTGPVARGDAGTVARHLDLLDRDLPELAAVYRQLAAAVLHAVRPRLDVRQVAAVEAALAPDRGNAS